MHSEAPSLENSENSRWGSVSFATRVCFVGLMSLGASTSKESQERGFVGLFHRWTVSDQKLLQWELLREWFFYYWWHSWTYPVQNSAFLFNSAVLYYLRQDFSEVCSLPFDCYVSLILFCQNSARYSSSHLIPSILGSWNRRIVMSSRPVWASGWKKEFQDPLSEHGPHFLYLCTLTPRPLPEWLTKGSLIQTPWHLPDVEYANCGYSKAQLFSWALGGSGFVLSLISISHCFSLFPW